MHELLCDDPVITHVVIKQHVHSHCKHDTVYHRVPVKNGRMVTNNIPGQSILAMYLHSPNLDLLKIRSVKLLCVNKSNGYEICMLHVSGPSLLTADFDEKLIELPFGCPFTHYMCKDEYDIVLDCEHSCPDLEFVFKTYVACNVEEQDRFFNHYATCDMVYTLTQTQYATLCNGMTPCSPLRIQNTDRACSKIVIASMDGKPLTLHGNIHTDSTVYPINEFEGKHLHKAPKHCYVLKYCGSADGDYRHIVMTRDSKLKLYSDEQREICITYYYHDRLSWFNSDNTLTWNRDRSIDTHHPTTLSLTHPVELLHLYHPRPDREYELPEDVEEVEAETEPEIEVEVESEEYMVRQVVDDMQAADLFPPPPAQNPANYTNFLLKTIAHIIRPMVQKRHTTERCAVNLETIEHGDQYTICPQCKGEITLACMLRWLGQSMDCPKCRYVYTNDDILHIYENCSYGRELLHKIVTV